MNEENVCARDGTGNIITPKGTIITRTWVFKCDNCKKVFYYYRLGAVKIEEIMAAKCCENPATQYERSERREVKYARI